MQTFFRCKQNYNKFANLWKPMEDFQNALCWTMIRDSPDSHPGPTVTVTHDCTNEISVFVFIIKNGFNRFIFIRHACVLPNILTIYTCIYMYRSAFSNQDKLKSPEGTELQNLRIFKTLKYKIVHMYIFLTRGPWAPLLT